ncbi:hypothetical protein CCR75_007619 [Bremia lactucae]|uniref:Uncharacterized protein n=1 Tax=Bremia lactucae TaxID=4779 RepID=A0A976IBE0_BRELC|nr:hypothetical protein CCR75_007619 [Bremia lactucae]
MTALREPYVMAYAVVTEDEHVVRWKDAKNMTEVKGNARHMVAAISARFKVVARRIRGAVSVSPMVVAKNVLSRGALHHVWVEDDASFMEAASDAKLRDAAIGHTMAVNVSSTAAQVSAACIVGVISTTKEADIALHTVVASPVASPIAQKNRYVLDGAARTAASLGVPWLAASVWGRPENCVKLTEEQILAAIRIARVRPTVVVAVFDTVVGVVAKWKAAITQIVVVATARLTAVAKSAPYLAAMNGHLAVACVRITKSSLRLQSACNSGCEDEPLYIVHHFI